MASQTFMQMFQLMLQMAGQRQQREIADQEFGLKEKQLDSMLKQWEVQHEDKDLSDAIRTIAELGTEGRQAFIKLQRHLPPDAVQALQQFAAAQPISPNVLAQQDVAAGFANRTPQQAAMAQNEAMNRVSTGMNVGQIGESQLRGALATGGAPPGQLGQVIPQQAWGTLVQNFAGRQAQGYTPEQMALQQGGLQFQYDQLDAQSKQFLASLGLEADKASRAAQAGLSAAERIDVWKGVGKLLEDINSPRSDEAGNISRRRALGWAAMALGYNPDYFAKQPTQAEIGVPTPATPWRMFIQQYPGMAPKSPPPGPINR